MDIDIPGAAVAHQSLEEDLAVVFSALLADDKHARDAVVEICNVCQQRAETARAEASAQLMTRAARQMALTALAEELDAQAATWQLLFCLYCDEAPPGGQGGLTLADAGGVHLYRQRVADRLASDAELGRCARVVAWLESLADESLKRSGGAAFAPGEGLWQETKTEMRAGTGSVASELDPDAPGRLGRPLHASNTRSQERILARVWQLLRAGRAPDALELCRHVGQPWRAAALGGGGPFGSLPVGATAAEFDEAVSAEMQAEELADEVSHGSGSLLALWRWAALQAAAAPPADRFERAVFGALGGSAAAAAPACGSWEDFAWSICRSWLESQVAKAVPPEPQAAGDLIAGDAVASALVRCGVAPAAAQRSVEAAMSIVLGTGAAGGGASMVIDDGAGTAVAAPARGFGQLFAQQVMTPGSLVHSGGPAVQALRQVQGLLVQGDMNALACHLYGVLVDRRGGGGSGGGAADVDGEDAGGGFAGGAAAGAVGAERRRRACALAAHMLLTLEGLGVLAGGSAAGGATAPPPDPFEVHKTLDLSQRLLLYYGGTLLERGQLGLVPPYLCALRPALRASLCAELLAAHTRGLTGAAAAADQDAVDAAPGAPSGEAGFPAADAACYGAYTDLAGWFGRCLERQAQQAQQGELRCRIATDIRPNELRLQLSAFVSSCRQSREYGPHARARVVRWLAYPHLAAAADAAATAAAEAAEAEAAGAADAAEAEPPGPEAAAARLDPVCYYDALDAACCVCCELALGDDVTAAAGHVLFAEVLPEDLELAALAAAVALEEGTSPASASLPASDAPRLAEQLRSRAAELSDWRRFFHLDAQLAGWTAAHEAATQAAAAAKVAAGGGSCDEEVAALVEGGSALLQGYLQGLLQSGWQRAQAAPERALAEAAAADGVVRVTLTVTAPPAAGLAASAGGAAAWGQPTAPYPEIQGAALLEFTLALEAGLQRAAAAEAAAAGGRVELAVAVEAPAEAAGHVTVNLAAAAEPQSWQSLVSLVCGAVRGGLEGLPPLLLVGLQADRATSAAVARRCCISQAVLRCAALRLSLVSLGADAEAAETGPQLLEMLAEPPEPLAPAVGSPAAVAPAGDLLELLSGAQLQQVLAVEADTVVRHLRNGQMRRMRAGY